MQTVRPSSVSRRDFLVSVPGALVAARAAAAGLSGRGPGRLPPATRPRGPGDETTALPGVKLVIYDWALPLLMDDAVTCQAIVDRPETTILSTTYGAAHPEKGPTNIPLGWKATRGMQFASYQQFASMAAAKQIPSNVGVVVYNPEAQWTFTPDDEKKHPKLWGRAFATLAVSKGLEPWAAPSCTLMHSIGKAPAKPTKSCLHGIVLPFARWSEVLDIQIQRAETDPAAYAELAKGAYDAVRAVPLDTQLYLQLSTDPVIGVTVEQLLACMEVTRELCDGYWMALDADGNFKLTMAFAKELANVVAQPAPA